uniref:Leucine-rich repeat-containing protein 57-like n=1 Tax=Phallusia mammillata TaxID=59560 RepID=A0A6F9DKM1_9ASCI|nr:leucine-rich repeat-containing protein 57-like [Phallusia mammillata]
MGNSIKAHIEHAEKTGVCQLSSMNLSEFPSQVLKLSKSLRTLDLSDNKIQGIPEAIGNFTSLKTLTLNHNRLSILCSSICKLKKLEHLSVTHNRLAYLPPDLGECAALKTVVLTGNHFQSVPEQMATLKHLDLLDMSHNKITRIPENLHQLNAVELILNNNQIPSLPDCLASCPRLKVLRFQENCVPLDGISKKILLDSKISLLVFDGNLFTQKDFQQVEGYSQYMERYTATKKKFE